MPGFPPVIALRSAVPMHADPLSRALDEAIAGRRDALFDLLTRGSRLPGPRPNAALADAFAVACRGRGAKADALALAMARLVPTRLRAPRRSSFCPVWRRWPSPIAPRRRRAALRVRRRSCTRTPTTFAFACVKPSSTGSLASGRRGGRARRRDGVLDGWILPRRRGAPAPWPARRGSAACTQPDAAILRLDEAFVLARDAPRAAARYPGHKALLEALREGPPKVALRFGVPVFDLWTGGPRSRIRSFARSWRSSPRDSKLAGRFRPELEPRPRRARGERSRPSANPDHDHRAEPGRPEAGSAAEGRMRGREVPPRRGPLPRYSSCA